MKVNCQNSFDSDDCSTQSHIKKETDYNRQLSI